MNKTKIILTLFILLSIPHLIFSQKNEFSLSYSPLSVYKLGHSVEDGLTETNHSVLGAFTLDYYHYLNDWLKLGIAFMYDKEHSTGFVNYGYISEYSKTNSVFVIAPQIDFEYYNRRKLKLSSGFSAGLASSNNEATEGLDLSKGITGYALHFNLISFRWGEKQGLCGHMGFGYKGFLGLGYFLKI